MSRSSLSSTSPEMCSICGSSSSAVSRILEACSGCVKKRPEDSLPAIKKAHEVSRSRFGLPTEPPKEHAGVKCRHCGNECMIPLNGRGYCGLKKNVGGTLVQLAGTGEAGVLDWYYDPLPTNCVGDWVCAGGTGAGYPRYSYTGSGPEHGYKNLAVFYKSCTFDCLFCQNWNYRLGPKELKPKISASELAAKADASTSCICYFGGDPSSQILHALKASELALKAAKERILRICWETNGSTTMPFLRKMAKLSMESGGSIKFDLKARDEYLHFALTGASNKQTLSNFKWLSGQTKKRPEPPFLIASTLIVPGYVEAEEVSSIARFISELDPTIPYSLLAFSPEYMMDDLPTLSKDQAIACLEAAREHLENVRLANVHLLRPTV